MGGFLLLLGILLASGPKPEKKDVPYLVHTNSLVETEIIKPGAAEAAAGTVYSVPGESSPARTPLALPVFLLDASGIQPQTPRLIRLTSKAGHREAIVLKKPDPNDAQILLTVTNLGAGLYRFEVVNEIENGEYALIAPGSPLLFCFTVF